MFTKINQLAMMNILDKIIADKHEEIAQKKNIISVDELKKMPFYSRERISLKNSLLKENSTQIIAEFKRRSPSKGMLNNDVNLADVFTNYNLSAAGISVLTDEKYFGGSNDDLMFAKEIVSVPLLRKDFIIDEYQLYEARAIGADAILLIAACLSKQEVKNFSKKAKKLGLEILLEIHTEKELEHICDEIDLVGINNRNLQTFDVDINISLNLSNKIPKGKIAISESGISDVKTIFTLKQAGFNGFLIGEFFMKQANPASAFKKFVENLNEKFA